MKTYVASKTSAGGGLVSVVPDDPADTYLLAHHVHHSPDGFGWGYAGSAPAELARCILWDHLGSEPHPACYQDFKVWKVAPAPRDGFDVTSEMIDQWLAKWRRQYSQPATVAEMKNA